MAVKKSTAQQFVLKYLQELDVAPSRSPRQFLDDVAHRHGRPTAQRLEQAMAAREDGRDGDDIYTIKNESLRLSLDFARFSADLYRRFFEWLVRWKQTEYDATAGTEFASNTPGTQNGSSSPRSILDIGCDNGLVTCFLSRLFPDAEVVGVDKSPEAISCARQLADRLKLTHVTFVCADFLALRPDAQTDRMVSEGPSSASMHGTAMDGRTVGPFDLAISLRSLHEVAPGSFPWRYWSLMDLAQQMDGTDPERYAAVMEALRRNVSPCGQFITAERLTHSGMVFEFASALQAAGLCIEWSRCSWLSFHEVGDEQRMPILLARVDSHAGADGGSGGGDANLPQSVYRFLGAGEPLALRKGLSLDDVEAERALQSAENKAFLRGLEVTYRDNGGRQRYEFWSWNNLVLAYQASDLGFRELKVLTPGELGDVAAEFDRLEQVLKDVGTCEQYDRPR